MQFVLMLVVAAILMMLLSGVYIFRVACCRGKEINWLDEHAISNTPYKEFYSQIVAADKWLKDEGCFDVFIDAIDGIRLHGLWVSAEHAKGTVILFHGYRSTYLVDSSMALEFFHSAGYNLLIPDQRAHGKSGGKYITFGVKESEDVLQWIGFHNRTFGNKPIILSGLSMGASTVLYVADRDLPPNVKGIIADCGFTSPKAILCDVYRKVIHLPPVLSMWAVELFTRFFAGFSISQKDTTKVLANSKVPVLMIHGRSDTFVPYKMTEEGFNACTSNKKLLIVDGADHGVSFIHDREGYTKAVVSFLQDNVHTHDPDSQ